MKEMKITRGELKWCYKCCYIYNTSRHNLQAKNTLISTHFFAFVFLPFMALSIRLERELNFPQAQTGVVSKKLTAVNFLDTTQR